MDKYSRYSPVVRECVNLRIPMVRVYNSIDLEVVLLEPKVHRTPSEYVSLYCRSQSDRWVAQFGSVKHGRPRMVYSLRQIVGTLNFQCQHIQEQMMPAQKILCCKISIVQYLATHSLYTITTVYKKPLIMVTVYDGYSDCSEISPSASNVRCYCYKFIN